MDVDLKEPVKISCSFDDKPSYGLKKSLFAKKGKKKIVGPSETLIEISDSEV